LIQEKKDLQNELHSYMNRFSELQIHKENLEANLNNQIKVIEAKLASNNLLVQQKDSQVNMNKFFIRIRQRIHMINSGFI
jgi:ribosomal protein S17